MLEGRSTRPTMLAVAWLLAVGAALVIATATFGQGSGGTLPDPISTRQLTSYADRLALSPQQRLALESIHDEYKRDFRTLTEGEIAAFLEAMQAMEAGGMPQRVRLARVLDDMERLLARIRSYDDRLFDRMLPLLSEPQAARLPRVRLARERERYTGQVRMTTMGRRIVDLSELYREIDVPPDAAEAADAVMARYERQLTVRLREIARSARRLALDVMDALAERGYADLTETQMNDPALVARMMKEMQTVFAELTRESNAMIDEVVALNRRTYRSVATLLPDEPARALRAAFYPRSYGELRPVVRAADRNLHRQALEHGDLTPEQHAAVAGLAEAYRLQSERLLAEGVRRSESDRPEYAPFGMDDDVRAEYQRWVGELTTRATALESEAETALVELIGTDAVAAIRTRAAGRADAGTTAAAERGLRATGAEPDFTWSGDQFVASRLGRREVDRIAETLGLDPDRLAVVRDLHDEYASSFEALPSLLALREATRRLWRHDPTRVSPGAPTDEDIEQVVRLRRETITAVETLDETFFDDVRRAVATTPAQEAALDRRRRQRQRAWYMGTASSVFSLGSDESKEGILDLVALCDEQAVPDPTLVAAALLEYEAAALDALRSRLETQLALQQVSDRWNAAALRAGSDVATRAEAARRYRELADPVRTSAAAAGRRVVTLNRRTLDAMLAALPAAERSGLRRTYDRAAFPTIFDDPDSIERRLGAALALPDLSPDQRESLREIAASFRPEHDRLSRALVEIVREQGEVLPLVDDAEYWRRYRERQSRLQRIRFDCDELSDRTANRLRAVLRQDQIDRLGGLAAR